MSPTIRIDHDVYEALRDRAEPFTDTPNSVLRRVLGLSPAGDADPDETGGGPTEGSPRPPSDSRHRKKTRARKSSKRKRAATGTILSEDQYELPLLATIRDKGGSAPASEVIEELGKRLNGKLKPRDYEELNSGRIRWHNRAQFVRLRLVERGEMKKDSPRGIWEIADQGVKRLAQASDKERVS